MSASERKVPFNLVFYKKDSCQHEHFFSRGYVLERKLLQQYKVLLAAKGIYLANYDAVTGVESLISKYM